MLSRRRWASSLSVRAAIRAASMRSASACSRSRATRSTRSWVTCCWRVTIAVTPIAATPTVPRMSAASRAVVAARKESALMALASWLVRGDDQQRDDQGSHGGEQRAEGEVADALAVALPGLALGLHVGADRRELGD